MTKPRLPLAAVNVAAALLLAALAVIMVIRLGPFGLILLGLVTLFVSSQLHLNDSSPVAGIAVFQAQLRRPGTPEQRAEQVAERTSLGTTLRFARNCGLLLTAAGLATFVWQLAH